MNLASNRQSTHSGTPLYIGLLPSSPIGSLWVASSAQGLVAIGWTIPEADFTRQLSRRYLVDIVRSETRTSEALRQISEYLLGERRQFELPLDLSDLSDFQRQVLRLTAAIPYGQTTTYKEIAARIGRVNAARAVGRVQATNPIPLVIPCHRVLGSDGSLHGYGGPGGIKLKAWLLKLEGAQYRVGGRD
jgi:methylated-DNA-[protein]-cysteine S-methyltransferase